MIRGLFFNSINGDRIYNAEDFTNYLFRLTSGNGILPIPSNACQVLADNKMNIIVSSGNAWIKGKQAEITDHTLQVDIGNSSLDRKDLVVIRLNSEIRDMELIIKKGTPSSKPQTPILVRDELIYELGIAEIYVNKGDIALNQGQITDLRYDKKYCGIVTGLIENIDTETLYKNYEHNLIQRVKELDDILSDDAAGKIMAMIQDKQDKVIKDEDTDAEYIVVIKNGRPYLKVVKV